MRCYRVEVPTGAGGAEFEMNGQTFRCEDGVVFVAAIDMVNAANTIPVATAIEDWGIFFSQASPPLRAAIGARVVPLNEVGGSAA
jgi:hypothetical protein